MTDTNIIYNNFYSNQGFINPIIWILLISPLTFINVAHSSIIFGFETANNSNSIVTLTLFWNAFKYQCYVNPTESNTYYSCDTSIITTTTQCIANTSNSIKYGLQIDIDHHDSLEIDQIIIKNIENGNITNIPYDIDYFSFNSTDNGWDIYNLVEFIAKNESFVHIMDNAADCKYNKPQNRTLTHSNAGNIFNLIETAKNTQIIIGICLIFGCCIIPLLIGEAIFCYILGRKNRNNVEPQSQLKQDNIYKEERDDEHSLTPPGLIGVDSMRLSDICSGNTNYTLNMEGLEKETKLKIIDCILDISNATMLEMGEISINQREESFDGIDGEIGDSLQCDINKPNLDEMESEISDEMYDNPHQFIDDKIYTLQTMRNEQI